MFFSRLFFFLIAVMFYTTLYAETYTIRTLTGRIFKLDLEPTNTVGDIKLKINEESNIPIREQRISFNGTDLDDDQSIAEAKLHEEGVIYLFLGLKAGGPTFKDVTQIHHCLQTNKFGEALEAPDWHTVYPGLNPVGLCSNTTCKAYNQEVGCGIGFDTFDNSTDTKCPICNESVKAVDCIYYLCEFSITATKAGGEDFKSEWLKATDESSFLRLRNEVACSEFDRLVIYCRPLEERI